MTVAAALELRTVETPHVPVRYLVGGSGAPLLYLHGEGGLEADDPLLGELAASFHVHAPFLPGYGDSEECPALRDMLDFTLHTWDVAVALGLSDPVVVGASMGGMIAAEMAAVAPSDVGRLGLISPLGLWLDEHPVPDVFSTLPYQMPALLFHDPEAGAAMLTSGTDVDDPAFLQAFLVTNARQLGMAGRIMFPIPERGLSTRLYRIRARTVLVWGESDALVPPPYAHHFQEGIAGSELVMVPEAGHMVNWEKAAQCAAAVCRLLSPAPAATP